MSNIFGAVQRDRVIDFGELDPAVEKSVEAKSSRLEPVLDRVPIPLPCSRVARLRASALSPVLPFDSPQNAAAEQYRIIRTKLLHHPKKPQLIVVSSGSSGDGKTVTAINIAGSLALKGDSQVLLVDGDLRRPRIAAELNLPIEPGLADVLSGASSLESAIVQAEQFPNLFIVPAGSSTRSATELLESRSWTTFLEQIRARFTTVIFDAPPIATVADYELLQHGCDGVLVVARPDHSHRAAFLKTLEIIPQSKLLGVVLNCVEEWWLWKTPGYSYYRNDAAEQVTGYES